MYGALREIVIREGPLFVRSSNLRTRFVVLFLFSLLGCSVVFSVYYLFSQIFYNPLHPQFGGGEVFLLPRYYLGQNDLKTSIFRDWWKLLIVVPSMYFLVRSGVALALNEHVSNRRFVSVLFCFFVIAEYLFIFLMHESILTYIQAQSVSVNNGIFLAIRDYLKRLDTFSDGNFLSFSSLQYLYSTMYSETLAAHSLPFVGATHPPGVFPLSVIVKLLNDGIFSWTENPELYWAATVGLLNTTFIIFYFAVLKELFSIKTARLATVSLLLVPSVLFHFVAVYDILPAIMLLAGTNHLIKILKLDLANPSNLRPVILKAIAAGALFCLAAQYSFGIGIPILAFILAFIWGVGKSEKRKICWTLLGMFVVPIAFFVAEFIFSEGNVFYPLQGMSIATIVSKGLSSREYPMSTFANFTVMSVMGGLFFFPALFVIVKIVKEFIAQKRHSFNPRTRARALVCVAVVLMLMALLLQRTVRLEVERTWFWFFAPVWIFLPFFLAAANEFIRRLFPKLRVTRTVGFWLVVYMQGFVTLLLAVSVFDYY